MDALIGYTGFIGSELLRAHKFESLFNSRNIDAIRVRHLGTVVCAAAPGSMLEANRLPDRDRERIDQLIERLRTIEAEHFVLVSTIAVLDGFAAANESTTQFETETPYGVNRRRLEAFVLDRFERPLVLRLPALFGGVLRKNFLFDILNPVPSMLTPDKIGAAREALGSSLANVLEQVYRWDEALSFHVMDRAALDQTGRRRELEAAMGEAGLSAVQFTNPESRFQFYDIGQLWADIQRGIAAGVSVLHLAPTPLAAADIYRFLTGSSMPATGARIHKEDMRTAHAALWGKQGGYIADAEEVLAGIRSYFQRVGAA